jgi:formylmethanofuran dehydrogenase subunit C
MRPLSFSLKEAPRQRINLALLTPDRLAGKSRAEILATQLLSAKRRLRVSDLFRVSGEDPSHLVFRRSCDKLDRIGQDMASGTIAVQGDAGAYAGFGMRGGEISVAGNVGAFAASAMQGGRLQVHGNAGDFLAAAIPGERRGMQGGVVFVAGSAGDRAGDRMRRGTVLVAGDAGDYCGSRMSAGTIGVLGHAGIYPGLAMRRGTLLFKNAPERMCDTFNDCGAYRFGFLSLLARSWHGLDAAFARLLAAQRSAHRYMGDLAWGGKGEILVLSELE